MIGDNWSSAVSVGTRRRPMSRWSWRRALLALAGLLLVAMGVVFLTGLQAIRS